MGRLKEIKENTLTKKRYDTLLYNAIDMLLSSYSRKDILDYLGMTLNEYRDVMDTDE